MTQYVYLISCNGYFKVGIANDVESRLAQLQTGSPYELQIEECYEFENSEIVERAIHQAWKAKRVRGEWFDKGDKEACISEFQHICTALGGFVYRPESYEASAEDVDGAEEEQSGGTWFELVKVNSWYYVREMRWDALGKKKVYVRNIGSLAACKLNPEYSEVAHRLEAIKFSLTESETK